MGSTLKPDPVVIGYRYYMGMHMGLSRGPLDEIVQIKVADLPAWPIPDGGGSDWLIAEGPGGVGIKQNKNGSATQVSGSLINTVRSSTSRNIRAGNLFGGDKKEGGIDGQLVVMMGESTQVAPGSMKAKMGGLVPNFRGAATLYFNGLICALNPYPKPWKVRVRRVLAGWDGAVWQPSLAVIWLRSNMIKAMNPAHIIYECLTNRDWGRGHSRARIGEVGFLAAAQTLYNENLGLCMRWARQDELSAFIQEVIDHIGGSLYLDRTTGLFELSLLRGDYDPEAIPLFTYDTGLLSIEEDETAAGDDIINETIVNWRDPIKNDDRQVRIHNLASVQATGAIKSTTTTYDGLPTSELALRIAQRDLKGSATTLKRYKIILDRRAWRLIPGAVFRINAADKNIFNVVLRAGKVAEASVPDGRITVDAVLDVFGLPSASFIDGQDSEWQPPDRSAVIPAHRLLREATYGEVSRRFSESDLAALPDTAGFIATAADKPTALSQSYRIATRTGSEAFVEYNSGVFTPMGYLSSTIGFYSTTIAFEQGADLGMVNVGETVQIENEICRLDDITTEDGITGTITIARGCQDTLPATHAAGTPIFFLGQRGGGDTQEYAQGETVDVKMLTVTSSQKLELDLAPTDSIVIAARQARPWPPANLKVGGTPFANVTVATGSIALTWAHRDRTLILDQLVEHGAGSVGPEAGTTYRVRVYNSIGSGTPKRTVDVSGASWTYTTGMAIDDVITDVVIFEIEARRSGIASQFKYRFSLAYTYNPADPPLALAAFTALGPTTAHLSATTPADSNTGSIQFYRAPHGTLLDTATHKLGGELSCSSSQTVTFNDTPGAGNWDYWAQPFSATHVAGPIGGPVNLVLP